MRVLDVEEVARILGLHPKTVLRHIRAGRLAAAKAGGQWRVREEDLGAFLGGHRAAFAHRLADDVGALARGETPAPTGDLQACVIVTCASADGARTAALTEVFLRAMNADDPGRGQARFQSVHDTAEPQARFVLWGRPGFLARVLQQVDGVAGKEWERPGD